MCGILAVIGPKTLHTIGSFSKRMSHRGPDESDIATTTVGTVCHERLAIMDVRRGIQPIRGTRNTWVCHNGEIYNYKQLYSNQLGGVIEPNSTSDSEVIIHLYERFGSDLCAMLEGMFALVVLDEDKNTYLVARDPVGIKPLYWGKDDEGHLWFASEMKALHDTCMTFDVFPPGHFYTPESGFVRYFKPKWESEIPTDFRISGIRELLEESVRQQMMCDVPFGVLLSGGLDSSLISSIAAREMRKKNEILKSFAVGTSLDAPDIMAARIVAKFIGTEHHEVCFSVEDGIKLLPKLIWHLESYDVTTIRASIPMYFLTKYIREQGLKMVLSGEGADELFGGYFYYHFAPSDASFHEETKRAVKQLNTANLLRVDKSTMANSMEVRVPFLDANFMQKSLGLSPKLRRPYPRDEFGGGRIEKWVLRTAFDVPADPYLPDEILWRKEEQFIDGVGYDWFEGLVEFCNQQVTDKDMQNASKQFPINSPQTKDAYFIRKLFSEHFPCENAARTVQKWIPKWQKNTDPSVRLGNAYVAN